MNKNDGYSYRHVVTPESAGRSILDYLVSTFSHSDQHQWSNSIAAGELSINNQPVNGNECVRAGDVVIWNRPGWIEPDTPQHYEIIYCDQSILVVNKPSGLPTLPGGGFYRNTLLSLVRNDFDGAKPLHRLGRGTSGLVLFALDSDSAAKLTEAWPTIRKQYRALSAGSSLRDEYDIQCSIGKCQHPRLGWVYAASTTGKSARSVARCLHRRSEETLFEVDLHTGRPHQIRIHLAYIGHPLVGDPLFAVGGGLRDDQPGLPGDSGYWLHACRLELIHPVTQRTLQLDAAPPENLM